MSLAQLPARATAPRAQNAVPDLPIDADGRVARVKRPSSAETKGSMKVLFATDGSESAKVAQDLIAGLPWPESTALRVLHVLHRDPGLPSFLSSTDPLLQDLAEREIESARQALNMPGHEVEAVVAPGRPASRIVDEARAMSADVVVLGSHGRGALGSTVLGSVAAEVVDYAPCPVLVARSDQVTGVVLAHDGSSGARQAEAVVLAWPFLRTLPVRVVTAWSVAPGYFGHDLVSGPLIDDDTRARLTREARDQATRVARQAAARLGETGVVAIPQVLETTATDAIVAVAGGTDLIVMGTRGTTGLKRLLLGSVARGVLHRARSSVLFVPQHSHR